MHDLGHWDSVGLEPGSVSIRLAATKGRAETGLFALAVLAAVGGIYLGFVMHVLAGQLILVAAIIGAAYLLRHKVHAGYKVRPQGLDILWKTAASQTATHQPVSDLRFLHLSPMGVDRLAIEIDPMPKTGTLGFFRSSQAEAAAQRCADLLKIPLMYSIPEFVEGAALWDAAKALGRGDLAGALDRVLLTVYIDPATKQMHSGVRAVAGVRSDPERILIGSFKDVTSLTIQCIKDGEVVMKAGEEDKPDYRYQYFLRLDMADGGSFRVGNYISIETRRTDTSQAFRGAEWSRDYLMRVLTK